MEETREMKVLGIAGSTRKDEESGVYTLVEKVLQATGLDYELIHLRGRKIGGCIACLGCVKDNVCKVEDDLAPLRGKIVEADAYVVGAPNYYSGINGLTHAFLERWYQFRHQEGDALWGKLGVAVGVGGTTGRFCTDEIEKFFVYNFIEPVARVSGQGAASCFTCGYGETCKVGVPHFMYGEGVKITEDITPRVSKQPEVLKAAVEAGHKLGQRLRGSHDRREVTQRMQAALMAKFKEST
jgi:multimeric flavodoxin WrbA